MNHEWFSVPKPLITLWTLDALQAHDLYAEFWTSFVRIRSAKPSGLFRYNLHEISNICIKIVKNKNRYHEPWAFGAFKMTWYIGHPKLYGYLSHFCILLGFVTGQFCPYPSGLFQWHGPLPRYVNLRVAHAPGMPGTFSPPSRFSDPDMHHGTCVTHMPWCMSGSLTSDFLGSRWRGKHSRHSRPMRNPQFCVSCKRPKE